MLDRKKWSHLIRDEYNIPERVPLSMHYEDCLVEKGCICVGLQNEIDAGKYFNKYRKLLKIPILKWHINREFNRRLRLAKHLIQEYRKIGA